MLYRDHRGSLADSLATQQTFATTADLLAYLQGYYKQFGRVVEELKSQHIGPDARTGWDTHYISLRLRGDTAFSVAGMADAPLPAGPTAQEELADEAAPYFRPVLGLLRVVDSTCRFGWLGIGRQCEHNRVDLEPTRGGAFQSGPREGLAWPAEPYSAYLSGSRGSLLGFAIDWLEKGYAVEEGLPLPVPHLKYIARLDFVSGQSARLSYPTEFKKGPPIFSLPAAADEVLALGYYHEQENKCGFKPCWNAYIR